jgi:hypothetical protein
VSWGAGILASDRPCRHRSIPDRPSLGEVPRPPSDPSRIPTGNFARCTHLILTHASLCSDRYGASAFLEIIPSNPSLHACANKRGPSDTRWSAQRMGPDTPVSSNSSFRMRFRSLSGESRRSKPLEEKIEDIESQRLLPPGCKRSLEFGEVRPAVLHSDDFAVEDGPIDRDVERGRNRGETLRPVEPRPRADRHPTLVEMDLQAIAVVLDFVEPVVARGWLRAAAPEAWPYCFRYPHWTPALPQRRGRSIIALP